MAARLVQLKSKAAQATQFASKYGKNYYTEMMAKNDAYVQKPATVEACNELSKKLFYTRLASIPERAKTFKAEVESMKDLWKNRKDIKVEHLGVTALFGMECYCWFCLGEVAGRGFTFTGYYV
ncbi:hypothetical protein ACHQM5_001881 [Ranunculus cassubicifolius]